MKNQERDAATARNKRGRPTKYKPEFCQQLIDFFDVEPYEDVKIPHYKGKGDKRELVWTDLKRMANRLPTLRNFAKHINVSVRVIYNWVDSKQDVFHEEFLHAFTCAKEIRKWFLIENGLNGLYNPLFAKFVAINITDMEEKADITSKGEKLPAPPLTNDQILALIKESEDAGNGLPPEIE